MVSSRMKKTMTAPKPAPMAGHQSTHFQPMPSATKPARIWSFLLVRSTFHTRVSSRKTHRGDRCRAVGEQDIHPKIQAAFMGKVLEIRGLAQDYTNAAVHLARVLTISVMEISHRDSNGAPKKPWIQFFATHWPRVVAYGD